MNVKLLVNKKPELGNLRSWIPAGAGSSGYRSLHLSFLIMDSSSVSSEELLDEPNHLILLNGTGVILVEGGEHLIEGLI